LTNNAGSDSLISVSVGSSTAGNDSPRIVCNPNMAFRGVAAPFLRSSMPTALERYIAEILVPNLSPHDKPEIMLLTCMDYRYAHRIVDLMDRQGLRLKYDMFVLAGAALGGNAGEGTTHTVPAEWRDALVSHIRAARDIGHPISTLFVLEHRQCGAYQYFLGLDWEQVYPGEELRAHKLQVQNLAAYLKTVFHDLRVDSLLLTREEDDELCRNC